MLASCNLYSNYERPDNIVSDSLYRDTTSTYAILATDTANFGNTPWQEIFVEPELQTLINKALSMNADIRTADLTIKQAEASLKASRLAFFPSLSFAPTGTITSYDGAKSTKTYSIPVQASWQIDAFGSLRNSKKQYQAALEQSKAYMQVTRTSVIAAVANVYYTLQMLDEQLKLTKAICELWDKNVAAMEAMYEAGGLTNAAAVASAKANCLSVKSTIPTLEQSIREAENSMCVMLHEEPHPIQRGATYSGELPEELAVGVPVQLLSNRPDVRAAEMQLAYAFYGTNAARAAFYPNITLTGSYGFTNSGGSGITNPGAFLASAVGSLVQPLFNKGTLRANLKIAKYQQEAAQIAFESALLTAGQEVSNALGQYQTYAEQVEILEKQVKELEIAAEKTDYLFRYGNSTTYLETLTAQQNLLSAQLSLISDKFDKVQAVITLYQALGGGREL